MFAGEGSAQVTHGPARGESDRRGEMYAVEQEDAFAQRVEPVHERGAISPASGAGAFQSLEHALFVAVGLQATDEPRAAVGQRLVI